MELYILQSSTLCMLASKQETHRRTLSSSVVSSTSFGSISNSMFIFILWLVQLQTEFQHRCYANILSIASFP